MLFALEMLHLHQIILAKHFLEGEPFPYPQIYIVTADSTVKNVIDI